MSKQRAGHEPALTNGLRIAAARNSAGIWQQAARLNRGNSARLIVLEHELIVLVDSVRQSHRGIIVQILAGEVREVADRVRLDRVQLDIVDGLSAMDSRYSCTSSVMISVRLLASGRAISAMLNPSTAERHILWAQPRRR